jgi:hypothetical protein
MTRNHFAFRWATGDTGRGKLMVGGISELVGGNHEQPELSPRVGHGLPDQGGPAIQTTKTSIWGARENG